jgi:hypothetical protein
MKFRRPKLKLPSLTVKNPAHELREMYKKRREAESEPHSDHSYGRAYDVNPSVNDLLGRIEDVKRRHAQDYYSAPPVEPTQTEPDPLVKEQCDICEGGYHWRQGDGYYGDAKGVAKHYRMGSPHEPGSGATGAVGVTGPTGATGPVGLSSQQYAATYAVHGGIQYVTSTMRDQRLGPVESDPDDNDPALD